MIGDEPQSYEGSEYCRDDPPEPYGSSFIGRVCRASIEICPKIRARDGLNTLVSLKEGSHLVPSLFQGQSPRWMRKRIRRKTRPKTETGALLLQVRLHFSGEEGQDRGYLSVPGQGTM